jgi:hypothetical protein
MKGEFFLFHSNLKNQHSALINLLPTADTTTAYFDALGRSTHLARRGPRRAIRLANLADTT